MALVVPFALRAGKDRNSSKFFQEEGTVDQELGFVFGVCPASTTVYSRDVMIWQQEKAKEIKEKLWKMYLVNTKEIRPK